MKLDMYATEVQFAHHLAAVWHALPEEQRGDFIVPSALRDAARSRGIPGAGPNVTDPTRPVLVASYGDNRRVRRFTRTRIAYLEHGAGQSYPADRKLAGHPSYAGGKDRADVSLFLVPNEYAARLWRAAYPQARVEVVGCPKLDTLPAREPGPGPVICASFHWDGGLGAIPELRSAYALYRPVLGPLAERFRVIGHGHPRALDTPPRLRRYFRHDGLELVEDFEDVCRLADVYISDNSSTLFEFAATDRPVVVLNMPAFRRDAHHGLRFWEAADIGIQVDRPGDLADAVDLALSDPPEVAAKREAALGIVYARRAGAAERAADVLADWLGVTMGAVA